VRRKSSASDLSEPVDDLSFTIANESLDLQKNQDDVSQNMTGSLPRRKRRLESQNVPRLAGGALAVGRDSRNTALAFTNFGCGGARARKVAARVRG